MRHEIKNFTIGASGSNTIPVSCEELADCVVAITDDGADAFSVTVQGKFSNPGSVSDVWFDVGSALTADAIVPLTDSNGAPIPFTHIRLAVTTAGATKPKAVLVGRNHRTDR